MSDRVSDLLQGRHNNFDLIRLCAAVSVIFSHAYPLTGRKEDPLNQISGGLINIGAIAVAIFFIISGLLITRSFDKNDRISVFLASRILRIYPALIVTVIASTFILGPVFTNYQLSAYLSHSDTWKYLTNALAYNTKYVLPGVFEHNALPNNINGSLWTLPLEIGCYIAVLFLGATLRKQYIYAAVGFVLLAFLFRGIFRNINTYYFGLGALIYLFRSHIRVTLIPAIICLGIFIALLSGHFPGYLSYPVLGVTLAYLVLFIGFKNTKWANGISKYGDFSYGLYIWAFPVQQIISLNFPEFSVASHFVLALAITLIFAILSWHLIEKPALRLKSKLK